MSNWSPVEVPLSGLDFSVVEARAIKRVEGLGAQGQAGIVNANIMGRLGELAVNHFLKRQLPNLLVSDVADDASTPSDLEVSTADDLSRRLGIEVKTTSFANWYRRGRVIGKRQFGSTDAHAYVWCTTDATPEQETLFIMGWLPKADMADRLRVPPHYQSVKSPRRCSPPLVQARPPGYNYDEDDFGHDSYGRDDLASSHDPDDQVDMCADSQVEARYHDRLAVTDQEALSRLQSADRFWREGLGDISSGRSRDQIKVVGAMNDMDDLSDWAIGELGHQG